MVTESTQMWIIGIVPFISKGVQLISRDLKQIFQVWQYKTYNFCVHLCLVYHLTTFWLTTHHYETCFIKHLCNLTEALRVEFPPDRTDSCFSSLSLLQPSIQLFLLIYNIKSCCWCARNLLNLKQRKNNVYWVYNYMFRHWDQRICPTFINPCGLCLGSM